MNYTGNTWAGALPRNRNGAHSCWSTCSITWLPCKERASKALLRIRIVDGRISPWTSHHVDPFRVPWCRNPEGGRTSLQGRACSCIQCTPLQTIGWVHEEAVPKTCQAHGQSWSTEWGWIGYTLFKRLKMLPKSLHLTNQVPLQLDLGGQKWPSNWKKTPLEDNQSQRGIPILGAGISLRHHKSSSPQCPSRNQSPSPSPPPQSHPADEWLSCSMKNLDLQTRPHESRSRVWWHDVPSPADKLKKTG